MIHPLPLCGREMIVFCSFEASFSHCARRASVGCHFSQLTQENSLFCFQKFPVPLRREFELNYLSFGDNQRRRSLPRVGIFKIPCYFPCYQGIWMLRRVRIRLHPPPRSRMRTDVSWSLTNSPQFAGHFRGFKWRVHHGRVDPKRLTPNRTQAGWNSHSAAVAIPSAIVWAA